MNGSHSYYDVLGISNHAQDQEIRKAYRELAFKFHPDKTSLSRDKALEKFKEVNEAYEVLSNDRSRAVYDVFVQNQKQLQDLPNLNNQIIDIIQNAAKNKDSSDDDESFLLRNKEQQNKYNQNLNNYLHLIKKNVGHKKMNNLLKISRVIVNLIDEMSESEDEQYQMFKKEPQMDVEQDQDVENFLNQNRQLFNRKKEDARIMQSEKKQKNDNQFLSSSDSSSSSESDSDSEMTDESEVKQNNKMDIDKIIQKYKQNSYNFLQDNLFNGVLNPQANDQNNKSQQQPEQKQVQQKKECCSFAVQTEDNVLTKKQIKIMQYKSQQNKVKKKIQQNRNVFQIVKKIKK